MRSFRTLLWLLLVCCLLPHATAQDRGLTEKDFLGELPMVYTVSRLPQPLNEAAGAVSVIDRDLIRRSGAREIADLLRLVPGFQVTYARGGNGIANYHGAYFDLTPRMQVLVDGRSVYSVHYVGGTSFGMRSVALEDIERIEILRGSNSANYGARAFLGVINIITREPQDTLGGAVGVTTGQRGINDGAARAGWGDADRAFRLSANWRGDQGLRGVPDENRLRNLNFRGDLRIDSRDELELRAGASEQSLSDGFPDSNGDSLRTRRYYSHHLQADWRRALGPEEELSLHFSHSDERFADFRTIPLPAPFLGVDVDFGGRGRVASAAANHRFAPRPDLRVSWGGEWRSEADRATQLFNGPAWIRTRFLRIYGNLEWRLRPELLLNAGAMLEHSSAAGSALMPRAMLNWRVVPEHTLRAGVSTARRTPSAFETRADQRLVGADGTLVDWVWRARGDVRPEHIRTAELGWFGELRAAGLSVDARLFHERIRRFLELAIEPLPAGTELAGDQVQTFANGRPIEVRGLELEATWRPRATTQLRLGHALLRPRFETGPQFEASLGVLSMPRRASSLMWLERLPGGIEGTLTHLRSGPVSWAGTGGELAPWHRTDLRLGYPFRLGSARAEAALVVQNVNRQPYNEFNRQFQFGRRAFATLKLEL
jgi:iron complex outermembrane receptor protein